MDAPHSSTKQAREVLDFLPLLRRWVTGRVQATGVGLDLSLRQYAALRGILDGAESPGDLARLWNVTPAVITGIVDRLERRDLVRREPDARDRRRQRLALTPAGVAASEEVERVLLDELASQLARATPVELAELSRSLDLLQRSIAALEARVKPVVPSRACDDMPVWSEDEPIPHNRLDAPGALAVSPN